MWGAVGVWLGGWVVFGGVSQVGLRLSKEGWEGFISRDGNWGDKRRVGTEGRSRSIRGAAPRGGEGRGGRRVAKSRLFERAAGTHQCRCQPEA